VIDAYASLAHYGEHIAPVWRALPDQLRGQWLEPRHLGARDPSRTVLVAGWRDAQAVAPSPLVYLEHGAGQSYDGDPRAAGNGSYSGGQGLERVRLFLCPSERVADRWRAVHRAPAVAVGCPKLDAWHLAARWAPHHRAVNRAPTVAVTFHWECRVVPETRSAWRHYDRVLPVLALDPRWQLLGHGHPRLWGTIRRRWQQLQVQHTAELADVLDQADVLVADNTSALYEFASTGRPVVVLNAPWYRRDVHHGLRFWSHPPGLQVDRPDQLADGIARALADPPALQRLRAAAVAEAYAHTDGLAAQRAATAITKELHHA
jgi:hypothetical protein